MEKEYKKNIRTVFIRLKTDVDLPKYAEYIVNVAKDPEKAYFVLKDYIESVMVDYDPSRDYSQKDEVKKDVTQAIFDAWWERTLLHVEKQTRETRKEAVLARGEKVEEITNPEDILALLWEPKSIIRFLPAADQLVETEDSVAYGTTSVKWVNNILIYEAGRFVFSGDIFYHPNFREFEKRIITEKVPLIPGYEKACQLAKNLSSQYVVPVAIVDNDQIFYSDEFVKKSIQEDTYFISAESPDETAKISEHLIRFQQLKFRLMIDAATAKRVEQSTATSQALGKTIDEIKEELQAAKKKPTLSRIAEILTERGVASPRGKKSKWHAETVKRILERGQNSVLSEDGQTR